MDDYIKTLQEMLDKYERMPDVCGKLLIIEAKILSGRDINLFERRQTVYKPNKHMNDEPKNCWFCKNFRLIPINGAGMFKCENKNTPDELKSCFNFDKREESPLSSYEINIV